MEGRRKKKAIRKAFRKGILEAVAIYREELELDDEVIIEKIMKKFSLSRADAEEYVTSSVIA